MVPTRTGKPGKKKHFPVEEKSENFTQSEEKLSQFYFFSNFLMEVYLLNSLNKILENGKKILGKVREICPKMWEP